MGKSVIRKGAPLACAARSGNRERRVIASKAMNRIVATLAIFASLPLAGPAAAVPGGEIGTLEQGRYTREMPGDATGAAGLHVPHADFTVISASSYRADGTLGSYLLTGDRVVMTNGPHRGQRFHRQSRGFLRQIDVAGAEGPLRCVLGRRRGAAPAPCPDAPPSDAPSLQAPQAAAPTGQHLANCRANADGDPAGRG